MKQVLQDVRSGEIAVHDVPEPGAAPGCVLVAVRHSVISAGTERALAGLGSKSLLQKARARPDLVRKTLDTARSEGVGATVAKVRGRLDEYTAFGYSCAGEVLDTGGDPRLAVGMRRRVRRPGAREPCGDRLRSERARRAAPGGRLDRRRGVRRTCCDRAARDPARRRRRPARPSRSSASG